MGGGLEESTSNSTSSSGKEGSNINETGDFECNICFELAQDPVVTLCGHLFCWPCLCKWLHLHSQSQECPVCKALICENELIPLYGRGKPAIDPRSQSVPGVDVPSRPSGRRPETAPPPDHSYFSSLGFGFLGAFMPMASATFGNMTMSAGFGGLFPSLSSFQLNGFPEVTMYGAAQAHGFTYGYSQTVEGAHDHGVQSHGQDSLLQNLLFILLFFVLLTFLLPGSLSCYWDGGGAKEGMMAVGIARRGGRVTLGAGGMVGIGGKVAFGRAEAAGRGSRVPSFGRVVAARGRTAAPGSGGMALGCGRLPGAGSGGQVVACGSFGTAAIGGSVAPGYVGSARIGGMLIFGMGGIRGSSVWRRFCATKVIWKHEISRERIADKKKQCLEVAVLGEGN
ncbi:hypothetical protein Cgig2_025622 [Carnegiea gigantea]|uniref:E3 ubiquitin-protein ligase RMA n=1 Tax=Carnegiea gigantea TaxID=171969 RepID=A0A9Q1Q853_9CARY|nr:hypothetical protein Cgig2_025622 [Carnegiea gigantea]